MRLQMNFGQVTVADSAAARRDTGKFRIAVLGDFSGRANSGEQQIGQDLASRKAHRVDVDNLDQVIERFGIRLALPIGAEGGTVEVAIESMDDFHPDELYDKLDIFSELSGLRRQLSNSSTFENAARQVYSWLGTEPLPKPDSQRGKAKGTVIPNARLSDFASLLDRPAAMDRAEVSVQELARQIVAPYVVPAKDPRQDELIASVDQALSGVMRGVLHHPDFQAVEALWRSVEMLLRRLEIDVNLQVVLYDITAEELAADLSSGESLEDTGLYKLLVEQPASDAQQGPISVILGNYIFQQTPPHAELLGRMAKIAAAAGAPFISAVGVECLKSDPGEVHPLMHEAWEALRALPEAVYVALTVPRFMLRWPYGAKTEPISRFKFEEFTKQTGVRGMLWGNSCFLAGLVLGLMYERDGLSGMKLGSILTVDDLPMYFYTDDYGDQVALPCTERLVNVRTAERVLAQRIIPVLAIQGQPEVRLGGVISVTGAPLAGPWAPVAITGGAAAPVAAAAAVTDTEPSSPSQTDDDQSAFAALEDEAAPTATESSPAEDAETSEVSPSGGDENVDDELDALLASLDSSGESSSGDDMDPDLAALLADL